MSNPSEGYTVFYLDLFDSLTGELVNLILPFSNLVGNGK